MSKFRCDEAHEVISPLSPYKAGSTGEVAALAWIHPHLLHNVSGDNLCGWEMRQRLG